MCYRSTLGVAIIKSKMRRVAAFVALCSVVVVAAEEGAAAAAYVVYDDNNVARDSSGGFSLCLGAQPSESLRDSLLMCRELSYRFCVNSTLIGSVLQVDGRATRHFVSALDTPTAENVEKLAHLVDSALVLLYQSFSSQGAARLECAHEWRSWVCSRAFHRVSGNAAPLPLCASVCERVQSACHSDLQCSARHSAHEPQCTDFYRDSNGGCDARANGNAGAQSVVPVFQDTSHYFTSGTVASNALMATPLAVYICALCLQLINR